MRYLDADCLGAGIEELAPEASLTDDLAADSLELALAPEAETITEAALRTGPGLAWSVTV